MEFNIKTQINYFEQLLKLFNALFILLFSKLAHLREKYLFLRKVKKICPKLEKSGQLIHIYFDSVCFLGKMVELESCNKTVRINHYENKIA